MNKTAKTVLLSQVLSDMTGAFGPPAKKGWFAALDSTGKVRMVAGRGGMHLLEMNAGAQEWEIRKIVADPTVPAPTVPEQTTLPEGGASMDVTIYGPNLRRECGHGTFHVHKAGCAHGRLPKYRDAEKFDATANSRLAIVRKMYADQIAESGDPAEDFAHDFHWAPCVRDLPEDL